MSIDFSMRMEMNGDMDEPNRMVQIHYLNHLTTEIEYLEGRVNLTGFPANFAHNTRRKLKAARKIYKALKDLIELERPHEIR